LKNDQGRLPDGLDILHPKYCKADCRKMPLCMLPLLCYTENGAGL